MKVAKEFNTNHSTVIQHLKQIGKVKKLHKWVPHELTENQKISLLWSVIFSYSVQQQWTIYLPNCVMWWKADFIQQPAMTSSVVGRRRSSKAVPKAKLAPKQLTVTVWWFPACPIHYSFLNPGKTITSEKYAQQLMRWTEKCNACSQHWSIQRAQCLNAHHTANTSEVERIGLQSFASSAIFTWPLANWLPLL